MCIRDSIRGILVALGDDPNREGLKETPVSYTHLIVTHNNAIRNMVHKVIIIKDGQISEDYENETRLPAKSLEDL